MSSDVAKRRDAKHQQMGTLPLAVVLLLIFVPGCRPNAPRRVEHVVKIGLVAPFDGRNRDVGYDVIYGARLAIRQANEQRGPGQVRFSLQAVDDFGDPTMALQSAAAMVVDPGIVAVIGHWLPETTAAAKPYYEQEGLPFLSGGEEPLDQMDPTGLDEDFLRNYAEITPFDEIAGPYAGPAYDGVQLIIASVSAVEESGREIERNTVAEALETVSLQGLTGMVRKP